MGGKSAWQPYDGIVSSEREAVATLYAPDSLNTLVCPTVCVYRSLLRSSQFLRNGGVYAKLV